MPVLSPIQGTTSVKAGSSATFTDATAGGTWSSTNTAAMTINSSTGVATAVAAGTAQIVYTVGSDTTAINVTVQATSSLTNGINFDKVYNTLKNRVLWQSQGLISDSQRYFEDFHPLNDTNLIDDIRPKSGSTYPTLPQYLTNESRAVILEVVNAVYNAPQVIDKPKLAFWRNDMPLPLQYVANNGQFVGLKLYIGQGERTVKLNSVQLFFSTAASFNLYLYNDFFIAPIKTIPVTANAMEQTIINLGEEVILTNLVPEQYKGGRWYLGYYQNDLPEGCQAIYYPVGYNKFHPLTVLAFSAPLWTDPNGDTNFLRNNIGANNLMYGMNLEISTFVDATNTIVQNAHLFDELIGLTMAVRVVTNMIFSYATNGGQRAVQSIPELHKLYTELDGYKADEFSPYIMGLKNKVNRAIKTVKDGFQNKKVLGVGIA